MLSKIYKELSENLENKKIDAVSDILEDKKAQSPVIDSVKDKIRAFVQIQNGCDHRCTFCIIPFGRGNSRSVEYSIIIEQIRNLINKSALFYNFLSFSLIIAFPGEKV